MHICVGNLTIIGPDNGLSPGRRQAIIWTNAGILLIGAWGTYFSEILIGIHTFSFNKMHLKMSSAKWRPFCFGLNVLKVPRDLSMKDKILIIVVFHVSFLGQHHYLNNWWLHSGMPVGWFNLHKLDCFIQEKIYGLNSLKKLQSSKFGMARILSTIFAQCKFSYLFPLLEYRYFFIPIIVLDNDFLHLNLWGLNKSAIILLLIFSIILSWT